MAAELKSIQFRARLSYDQIKKYSGFTSHTMINDYMSIGNQNEIYEEYIDANTANIEINSLAIEVNEANIATNTANIATNTADIATITADIATNTANIATNTADITTNASNIYSNTAAILANTANIATNASSITDNFNDIVLVTDAFNVHNSSDSQHGVTGENVGNEDFCTLSVGGVVYLATKITVATASTAGTVIGAVSAAPAAYTQVYAQEQTDSINELKTKHDELLVDFNNLTAKFNALLASMQSAKQMVL